jgi:hypothetical protein
VQSRKQRRNRARDEPALRIAAAATAAVTAAAAGHRVRLAGARLAVAQHRARVAVERARDQVGGALLFLRARARVCGQAAAWLDSSFVVLW